MRIHLDLKRMRYVLEAARAQAITTAAETLGVTQSALSRSIAEVEDTLGVQLFHRLPRGIQLTPAGDRFVASAKRVLGEIEELVATVRETRDLVSGRLRIGVAPPGYVAHIRGAVATFAREHPGITIEIVTGTTQGLSPRLLGGELDLLISSSSYLSRWRELDVRPVAAMHFACMVRRDHPLTMRNAPLTELDVLDLPLVLPEGVEVMYSDVAVRYAHHGLPQPQPRYVIEDFRLIGAIVAATDAYYPLMSPMPDFDGLDGHFGLLRDALVMPPHFVSVAYSAHRPHSPAAERFQRLFESKLQLRITHHAVKPDLAIGALP